MPTLKYEVDGSMQQAVVPMGKRLINAIEDEAKVDQLHSCGGNAKCTTCRIMFVSGEPAMMTQVEKELLKGRGVASGGGVRLSCQMLMEHDMEIKIISRLTGSGKLDAGKRCADDIVPPPAWVARV